MNNFNTTIKRETHRIKEDDRTRSVNRLKRTQYNQTVNSISGQFVVDKVSPD